ncbi:MAG: DUF5752 family protein [Candidatus Humimicrobiaceae bacterium]
MNENKSIFKFYDCNLIISPTGQKASNLKEFLNILEESDDDVIYYHLFQSPIKHHLRYPVYPNDFANWTADALGDFALAEKLANFDPYDFHEISSAKNEIANIVEEHMWNLPTVPWARPGFEFYFCCSISLILDLRISASNLNQFKEGILKVSTNSIYYHFFEARRRNKNKMSDDFTLWLKENSCEEEIIKKIQDIDFYFYSISEIRHRLLKILSDYENNLGKQDLV